MTIQKPRPEISGVPRKDAAAESNFALAIKQRIAQLNWEELEQSLSAYGYAQTPPVLSAAECADLVQLYADDRLFRSHVEMARFRFGEGDYKYFAAPLPAIVQELRTSSYPHLAPIANHWMERLGDKQRFPEILSEFLAVCHRHGQKKPTPLLLHYDAGDYNCLHQDLYGEVAFPLQLTCFLSQPERDYRGGEFVLVEQRPRAQSKSEVIAPRQGEIVIFTTRYRPVQGSKGYYRVHLRHGVARVRAGVRYTLGVIFHDAK